MKIQKLGFSVSPWRLTTDDGKEALVRVPFKHPDIGWTTISEPICGNTKAECVRRVLEVLDGFVALKSESALAGASPIHSDPGKVTVTTDDHGRCVAVTRTDDEGRILSVIWEAGEMEKPVNARLVEALRRIERWFGEFPTTGQQWDDGSPMSYSACYGSNGERDYMRTVAREALAVVEAQQAKRHPSLSRSALYAELKATGAEIVESCCGVPDKCCALDKWVVTTQQIERAIESQQAEPVLPANKTRGGSTAWLQWALHIIRNRCPDVLTSHQYDCAAKAMAAGFAAKPVWLTDEQIERVFYPFGASANQLMIAISVGRAVELLALRANGYKVEG